MNYNFSFGTHSISVSASDGTADPVACSTTLSVIYHFDGFLSPISGADATGGSVLDPVRAFKLGSTTPFIFKTSCGGTAVSIGTHTLELAKWTNSTTSEPPIDATPIDAATTGNQFRAAGDEWHLNLDTKVAGLTKGIWKATAHLADGTAHTVWVELK